MRRASSHRQPIRRSRQRAQQLLHPGEQLILLAADVVVEHREGALHQVAVPLVVGLDLQRQRVPLRKDPPCRGEQH
jgi:hypothetical protein